MLIHPLAPFGSIIKDHLKTLGHVQVGVATDLSTLIENLAKHRPHIVFVKRSTDEEQRKIEDALKRYQLAVPVCWLPAKLAEGKSITAGIDSFLLSIAPSKKITAYAPRSRTIVLDEPYAAFAGSSKQNSPDTKEDPKEHLPLEISLFARQVERAVEHHAAARQYLRQVLVTDKGLRTEITYRAVHSSHKIFWLREHIFRWVGVLAHYLPGVEPDYLPPPAPPSPVLDFLFAAPPPESLYAATALLIHGFKPSWMASLRSILDKKFAGQSEDALLQETLFLSGWSILLREIAISHVRVMECALHPDEPWYLDGEPSRTLHRATGIWCDFWHLRHLRTHPHYLRAVANGVVIDGIKTPESLPVVPSFSHYVEVQT